MRRTGLFVLAAGTFVTTLCAQSDLILTNGKIITVDERFSIAQAVAIRGDRVTATGTDQEIARLAGANTRRIDLKGKAVIPGLIDNHMHLCGRRRRGRKRSGGMVWIRASRRWRCCVRG